MKTIKVTIVIILTVVAFAASVTSSAYAGTTDTDKKGVKETQITEKTAKELKSENVQLVANWLHKYSIFQILFGSTRVHSGVSIALIVLFALIFYKAGQKSIIIYIIIIPITRVLVMFMELLIPAGVVWFLSLYLVDIVLLFLWWGKEIVQEKEKGNLWQYITGSKEAVEPEEETKTEQEEAPMQPENGQSGRTSFSGQGGVFIPGVSPVTKCRSAECGKMRPFNLPFCIHCGTNLHESPATEAPPDDVWED